MQISRVSDRGRSPGGVFLGDEASNALTRYEQIRGVAGPAEYSEGQGALSSLKAAMVRHLGAVRQRIACGDKCRRKLGHQFLRSQFGAAIVNEVNFAKGRVKPKFFFDVGAGAVVYSKEHRSATLQVEGANLTDRVNVINFAEFVFPERRRPAAERFSELAVDI